MISKEEVLIKVIDFYNRGNAYAAQGLYDQAIADFSQAIRLKSDLVDAYNNRRLAYYAQQCAAKLNTLSDELKKLKDEIKTLHNNNHTLMSKLDTINKKLTQFIKVHQKNLKESSEDIKTIKGKVDVLEQKNTNVNE